MSISLRDSGATVVVLDVEGTTTPITFVYDVLFPYARAQLRDFLRRHSSQLTRVFAKLCDEHSADIAAGHAPPALHSTPAARLHESLADYAEWLMDRDRKSPGLKELQGMIWEGGYHDGHLEGELFPDVPDAFARWHAAGIRIAIYSSGSVLAQRLIFGHSNFGDMTRYIDAHFDTSVGAKQETASYTRIAEQLAVSPSSILFVSDAPSELEAARTAGFSVALCSRPGNKTVDSSVFPLLTTFTQIHP